MDHHYARPITRHKGPSRPEDYHGDMDQLESSATDNHKGPSDARTNNNALEMYGMP